MAVVTVNRRVRAVTAVAAGLAAATGLWLPAPAARAVDGQIAQYTPSANEWWLANWQVQQQVWPLTEGADVTVAVVDTGVQASVPDLRGAVVPGGDMLGDPGNGETDFATFADGQGQDGHGTAVAVLLAGQGYGTGTVGIAPQAKIMPVHVSSSGAVNAGNVETLLAGIMFAAKHGASVITVSLGPAAPSATSCDPELQDAVSFALAHNVVVVAASGDVNVIGPGPVEPGILCGGPGGGRGGT